MRFKIQFGWDPTQALYAYFEASTYEEAAWHARRLRDRIKILDAIEVYEQPLPGQTLGIAGKRIDASRWLESG